MFSLDDSEIDPEYVAPKRPVWETKKLLAELWKKFTMLTSKYDMEDWCNVRTEHYWKSDAIEDVIDRLRYKIKLIEYYNAKGVPFK